MNHEEYDDSMIEAYDDFADEFIESTRTSPGMMMFHVSFPVENFKNQYQETIIRLESAGIIVMVVPSEYPGVRPEYVKFD